MRKALVIQHKPDRCKGTVTGFFHRLFQIHGAVSGAARTAYGVILHRKHSGAGIGKILPAVRILPDKLQGCHQLENGSGRIQPL